MKPWRCPRCHRPFKHRNQAHSCVIIDPAVHLHDKSPDVQAVYRKLRDAVMRLGDVTISATKSTIMFVSNSTFLAVKPKRDWVDIEFLLDAEVNEYPVYKTIRANKSRVAHFVRLERPKDVSAKLTAWLKRSYIVTSSDQTS